MNPVLVKTPEFIRITLNLPKEVVGEMAELPRGSRSSFAAETLRKALRVRKLHAALDRLERKKKEVQIERKEGKWRRRTLW